MKLIKVIFSLVTSFALSWPILFTPSFALQPTAQTKNIEVINAWYGDDVKNAQATYATASKVVPKIKEVLNKYGFIAIPKEMHTFYGFDPLPNVQKKTALHIRYNGKEEHLRAPEGKDFVFPSNIDSTRAQKALSELKASLSVIPVPNVSTASLTDTQKLASAIRSGDFNLVRQLIEKGVKIEDSRLSPLASTHGGADSDYVIQKETVPARLAFAKYLIDKGYDINQINEHGYGPLPLLAHRIATDPRPAGLFDLFYGPLMELYINAGASSEQIQKAQKFLKEGMCILTLSPHAPCVDFNVYWKKKIEPLIQEKIKMQSMVSQDVQKAINTNDVAALKQLIDQKKITANQVIELANKAGKYTIVQTIAQYIEQKK